MTNYTREFLIRMSWLATFLITVLAFIVFWFSNSINEENISSVFRPVQRIQQLKDMQLALDNPIAEVINQNPIDCDARGLSILTFRTMDGFGLDEVTATSLLTSINQRVGFKLRCNEWVENIQYLAKNYKQKSANSFYSPEIDSALSEQVSWSRQIPCTYFRSNNVYGLMMGNSIRCSRHRNQTQQHALANSGSFRTMVNVSKDYLRNAPPRVVQAMNGADHLLTLDAQLQDMMDRWANCLDRKPCSKGPQLNIARHVSAVVLDAKTGDILAALCWGGACDRPQMKQLSHLGALLVEAPPASTAKLLHAMVLAQNPQIDKLMLQRQIKTSGQNDALVTKRNEWWEKQAICEGNNNKPCRHPIDVNAIAQQFKWNQNCGEAAIFCGRWGLIENSNALVIPGLLGHIHPTSTPQKAISLLPWADYDNIRQGKKKSDGSVNYMNTALSIQSVIGAGDTRTSALGLANLSLQISRLASGQSIHPPTLIRPWSPSNEGSTPAPLKAASQVVLGGMRKVLEPIEAGWKDPGTVANTLQRIFAKACTSECGLWAKTGTVSQQDPNFSGTSLYTSLIDVNQLRAWRNNEEISKSHEGRKLAVGFIVIPLKGVKSSHMASELGIQFAKEISEELVQP